MSGLLERIVRRRRASASSRLGPPKQNGHPSPFEVPYVNGHETELPVMHVNGDAGLVTDPVEVLAEAPGKVPDIADAPEAVEVPEEEPELVEDVALPEAVEDVATEPEEDEAAEAEEVELAETEPEEDELDEPAPIDDESPTMEHRVLVLDEAELEPMVADEPEPVLADEPEPMVADEPEPMVADEPEPAPAGHPVPEPRFRERGRIRRRARYLRRLREVQLRDIGGFMLELHRFGRERPDLLQAKVAGAAQTDAELRALDQALGADEPLRELREAGIGGVCSHCGAVHGSEDRFCATCGEPLRSKSQDAGHSPEFGGFFTQG